MDRAVASIHRTQARRRPGVALISVLMASAVVLALCLGVASLAIVELRFSDAYGWKTQTLMMAQAAVNQVAAEVDKARDEVAPGATEAADNPVDLQERFRKPVFLEGAEHFPGTVELTFDRSKDHFSVDNSFSSEPAAGWRDRWTLGRSVPPHAIQLLIKTQVGSHTVWYEAMLRRRWPYALTTTNRVHLMGAPTYARDRSTQAVEPSRITGDVLILPGSRFSSSRGAGGGFVVSDASLPRQEPASWKLDDNAKIFLDLHMVTNLLGLRSRSTADVSIGGSVTYRPWIGPGQVSEEWVQVTSRGNTILGDVNIGAPEGRVECDRTDNPFVGSLVTDVRPYRIVEHINAAFRLPDTESFRNVELQGDPPGFTPVPPEVPPEAAAPEPQPPGTLSLDDLYNLPPGGYHGGLPSPAPSPSGSASPAAGVVVTPSPNKPPYFMLYRDLLLTGERAEGEESFVQRTKYRIGLPTGNRYVLRGDKTTVYSTGAGIELHDCVLYINGNLDLSSRKEPLNTNPEPEITRTATPTASPDPEHGETGFPSPSPSSSPTSEASPSATPAATPAATVSPTAPASGEASSTPQPVGRRGFGSGPREVAPDESPASELSPSPEGEPSPPPLIGLRGRNATLIVNGTLIINQGSLSASQDGMVIYCRRLVTSAEGSYRGLLMVEKSAAISPARPGSRFEIEGALVTGGEPMRLWTNNPFAGRRDSNAPRLLQVEMAGLHLWSTSITYNSQYLKTLHRFGPLTLIALRQVE